MGNRETTAAYSISSARWSGSERAGSHSCKRTKDLTKTTQARNAQKVAKVRSPHQTEVAAGSRNTTTKSGNMKKRGSGGEEQSIFKTIDLLPRKAQKSITQSDIAGQSDTATESNLQAARKSAMTSIVAPSNK